MSPALEKLQSGKFIMFSFVLLLLCNLSKVRGVLKLQNGKKKKDRKKPHTCVRGKGTALFSASQHTLFIVLTLRAEKGKKIGKINLKKCDFWQNAGKISALWCAKDASCLGSFQRMAMGGFAHPLRSKVEARPLCA